MAKKLITNNDKGPRGIWNGVSTLWIAPNESREVEVPDGVLKNLPAYFMASDIDADTSSPKRGRKAKAAGNDTIEGGADDGDDTPDGGGNDTIVAD